MCNFTNMTTFAPAFTPQQRTSLSSIRCSTCIHGATQTTIVKPITQGCFNQGLAGLIVQLPFKQDVPSWSCASQQPEVLNVGAFNHPVIPITASPCGHMVYCLPATSWGNKTFNQKWNGIRDPRKEAEKRSEWLALERQDMMGAHICNQLGELQHSGRVMPKPTYVGLESGFWIEYEFLGHYGTSQQERRLTPQAYALLAGEYARCQQEIATRARRQTPTPPPSPSHLAPQYMPAYFTGAPHGYAMSGMLQPAQNIPQPPSPMPWPVPFTAAPYPGSNFGKPARASAAIPIVKPTALPTPPPSPTKQAHVGQSWCTVAAQSNQAASETTSSSKRKSYGSVAEATAPTPAVKKNRLVAMKPTLKS